TVLAVPADAVLTVLAILAEAILTVLTILAIPTDAVLAVLTVLTVLAILAVPADAVLPVLAVAALLGVHLHRLGRAPLTAAAQPLVNEPVLALVALLAQSAELVRPVPLLVQAVLVQLLEPDDIPVHLVDRPQEDLALGIEVLARLRQPLLLSQRPRRPRHV